MFEWIITLGDEINLFWKKFTLATILFILNRYIPLAYNLIIFCVPTSIKAGADHLPSSQPLTFDPEVSECYLFLVIISNQAI